MLTPAIITSRHQSQQGGLAPEAHMAFGPCKQASNNVEDTNTDSAVVRAGIFR